MTPNANPLGNVFYLGAAMWVIGMGVEVIADNQKSAFKADPANEGKFINTGIWARSQHPNYFGEILIVGRCGCYGAPVAERQRLYLPNLAVLCCTASHQN